MIRSIGDFMKKFGLITLFLSLTLTSYAADRDKARNISNQLDSYVTKSEATDPDRAVAYRSNRDNVDDAEVFETTIDTTQFTSNQIVKFTRDAKDSVLGGNPRCSGDYGEVTLNATEVIVTTARLPIRVLCTSDNGQHRVFWTTYKQ